MQLANYPVHRARLVIGMISGTSADGIDVALLRLPAEGTQDPLQVEKFTSIEYPAAIREQVMQAADDRLTLRQTAVLGTEIGRLFAEAALSVMPQQGCDLVASHGQTVCHLPEHATTLQIGDGAVIAARTGVTTVSDFRTADTAYGGQGAPLVPLFDAHVLAHPRVVRVAINLGGIANVTVIPPGGEPVRAWDTGPANGISDALCRLSGWGSFDAEGGRAAAGLVDEELLCDLLREPYFQRPSPKSTGLELFGESYARALLARGLQTEDLIRTALALSAQSLVDDLSRIALDFPQQEIELVFAGGGTSNPVFMTEISQRIARGARPMKELFFSDFGIPEAGREAAAFAFLGDRAARGLPGAAPGATGASKAAILGKFSFPA